MSITNPLITQYMTTLQPAFDGVLGQIQQEAVDNLIPIIPSETAHLLATLLSLKQPKKVLEVGCAVGFSAGLISNYLAPGGHITTIDRYPFMIKQAKENFARLGIEDKVTLLEGDALTLLSQMEGSFDLIFLDAAKGQYFGFFPHCMRLLAPDGLFIVDDILQDGRIAMDRTSVPRRQRTMHTRLQNFLDVVYNAPELTTTLIPIGDGLLVAHKNNYKQGDIT